MRKKHYSSMLYRHQSPQPQHQLSYYGKNVSTSHNQSFSFSPTSTCNPIEIPMIKDLIKQFQFLSPILNGFSFPAIDESPESLEMENPECSEFKIVEFSTEAKTPL